MSKPFTPENLSSQMDADFTWRLKELSDLKATIRRVDESVRGVLLRAFVALIYAHWEGYIRFCAIKYFLHISIKRKKYYELHGQFYFNSFLTRLDAFFRSRAGVQEKCQFLDEVLNSRTKRFANFSTVLIDTKSNLNTDVIRDICTICAVDSDEFEKERVFIDIFILKRRNEIAHGEEIHIPETELDYMVEKAINLMRLFRNLLVYDGSYLVH